jgi:predicted amidophosphoribosyltransferase
MRLSHAVLGALAPPMCAACGRMCPGAAIICTRCARRLAAAPPLAGSGPPGTDRAWSSSPHEGVARDLIVSLKYRRLLSVAEIIAERIQWLAPADLLSGEIVAVPTSPLRSLGRGFDPAREIAAALADRTGLPRSRSLARRGHGRQVGRRRSQRVGRPPRIHVVGEVPRNVVLVDDVLTTGATISACARALRGAGAVRIAAVTFSRRL